jgi:hypothetical protein
VDVPSWILVGLTFVSLGVFIVVSHTRVTDEGRANRLLIFARGITAPRTWFTPDGQRARTRSLIASALFFAAVAARLYLR